jgi:Zn-dependent M16 (insulinase) family peptidase
MWYYYDEMRDKNWIGADAYYHCLGSCKAARYAGPDVALVLGFAREATDWLRGNEWSNDDISANLCGIFSSPLQSCEDRCRPLAPPGMPLP